MPHPQLDLIFSTVSNCFSQKLTRKASEGSDSGVASQDDEMTDTKCRRENTKLSTTSSTSASHQVRPEADVCGWKKLKSVTVRKKVNVWEQEIKIESVCV